MPQPLLPDQPMSHKLMDIVCCSEKLVWAWTKLGRDYTPDICVTATADSTAPPQHWWRISWRELEPQNLLLSFPNPHLTYILNQKRLNCPERETRNMYWVQFSLSLTSFTKFSFASHSVILLSLCRFQIVTTFLPGKLICSSSFFTLLVALVNWFGSLLVSNMSCHCGFVESRQLPLCVVRPIWRWCLLQMRQSLKNQMRDLLVNSANWKVLWLGGYSSSSTIYHKNNGKQWTSNGSTGNARLNQFKGFIGSTKEAKRANERRIYKPPLSDFTLIPKLLHIHTLSLNYNYYAGTGPLLHLVFSPKECFQLSHKYLLHTKLLVLNQLVLNLQIELGRAPISSIIPNSK